MKRQEASLSINDKTASLRDFFHARAAARSEARRAAELAAWLEGRCPALWQQAAEGLRQRLELPRLSGMTQRGGVLVEAMRLAGVMRPEVAERAMRVYAELEGIRWRYYHQQAAAWRVKPGRALASGGAQWAPQRRSRALTPIRSASDD